MKNNNIYLKSHSDGKKPSPAKGQIRACGLPQPNRGLYDCAIIVPGLQQALLRQVTLCHELNKEFFKY